MQERSGYRVLFISSKIIAKVFFYLFSFKICALTGYPHVRSAYLFFMRACLFWKRVCEGVEH